MISYYGGSLWTKMAEEFARIGMHLAVRDGVDWVRVRNGEVLIAPYRSWKDLAAVHEFAHYIASGFSPSEARRSVNWGLSDCDEASEEAEVVAEAVSYVVAHWEIGYVPEELCTGKQIYGHKGDRSPWLESAVFRVLPKYKGTRLLFFTYTGPVDNDWALASFCIEYAKLRKLVEKRSGMLVGCPSDVYLKIDNVEELAELIESEGGYPTLSFYAVVPKEFYDKDLGPFEVTRITRRSYLRRARPWFEAYEDY